MRQLKRPRYQPESADRSPTPDFGGSPNAREDSSLLRKLSGLLRPTAVKYAEPDSNQENSVTSNYSQEHESFDSSIGKPRFSLLPNLAAANLGARVIFVSDEYYGAASNLLDETSDLNWETRRRRTSGHDWVLIQLASAGTIKGIEITVAENDRNMAPSVSIEAGYFKNLEADIIQQCVASHPAICRIDDSGAEAIAEPFGINSGARLKVNSTFQSPEPLPEDLVESVNKILDKYIWDEILPLTRLRNGKKGSTFFSVIPLLKEERKVTHLRLNVFPDGAITKIRVFGEIRVSTGILRLAQNDCPSKSLEVAGVAKGGWVVHCSSSRATAWKLLQPQNSSNAQDAWITPRQILRPPILIRNSTVIQGEESVVIKLATRCAIESIELHTHHLWGEFPACCNIDVLDEPEFAELPLVKQMLTFSHQHNDDNSSRTPPVWIQLEGDIQMKPHDDNRVLFAQLLTEKDTPSPSKSKSTLRPTLQWPPKMSAATHIRIRLRPDGALSRIRVLGRCANTPVELNQVHSTHTKNMFLPTNAGPTAGPGRRLSIRRRH